MSHKLYSQTEAPSSSPGILSDPKSLHTNPQMDKMEPVFQMTQHSFREYMYNKYNKLFLFNEMKLAITLIQV